MGQTMAGEVTNERVLLSKIVRSRKKLLPYEAGSGLALGHDDLEPTSGACKHGANSFGVRARVFQRPEISRPVRPCNECPTHVDAPPLPSSANLSRRSGSAVV